MTKVKLEKPLKAYAVREDNENTGGIYYARHAIEARKWGADEYNDGELHRITCRRAPWADAYAPGPCPPLVMIEAGWWFECGGCGVRVDNDYEATDSETDEVRVLVPVDHGGQVYCTEECYLHRQTRNARLKAREAEAIEWLALELLHKLPGVTLTGSNHAYCSGPFEPVREVRIGFTFPGAKIGAANYCYTRDKNRSNAWVCGGDLEAWKAFRANAQAARTEGEGDVSPNS